MNKEKPPVLNRIEAILRAEETADLLPPWSCLPVGDPKWIELKAKRIEPLIQQERSKYYDVGYAQAVKDSQDIIGQRECFWQAQVKDEIKQAKAEVAREIAPLVAELFETLYHADFSNGIEAFGIDEGRVRAKEYIKRLVTEWQSFESKYMEGK